MTKYKVEIIDQSGERHYIRTIKIPRLFDGNIREYLMSRMHKLIEPSPKYRHTFSAFWKEFTLLQYWKP